jgi:ketosteroid isomerase-like protein
MNPQLLFPPLLALVLWILSGRGEAMPAQQETRAEIPTQALAERYLELLSRRKVDTLASLLHEDALFENPTQSALGGEARRIRGKDAILASFGGARSGTSSVTFEVESSFASGEYVVLSLLYTSHASAGVIGRSSEEVASHFATVTVLRFVDGLVVHHLDHVDYDSMLQQLGTHDAHGRSSALDVGERYLEHLHAFEVDELEKLLAPSASFSDPTAALVGGPWKHEGRAAILESVRTTRESTRRSRHRIDSSFSAGEYAVFALTLSTVIDGKPHGIDGDVELAVAAVTILRVVDGKVVEQLDLVDHGSLLLQIDARK